MREKLNSNPLAQLALVGVLLLAAGFFVMSTMGKGGEEESSSAPTEATVTVAGSGESGTATASSPGEAVEGAISAIGTSSSASGGLPADASADAPPPPKPVLAAYHSNKTVVLLFVRNGGIDDRMVKKAVQRLQSKPNLSTFIIPADQIARYASIAEGVVVDRVPALVVVRPKNLKGDIPVASVSYGFASPESVVQAVVDAEYEGRTLDYHP
ncbi:MAG TPA: hypothetical protein VH476_10360 [Solirubrobacterales bacterium]|jgi:hypothetical protein